MTFRRATTIALVPALVTGALALGWLGIVALQAAMALGRAETWLMAWTLAFVVGLPRALPLLALAHRVPFRIWERKSRPRDNLFHSPAHRGSP